AGRTPLRGVPHGLVRDVNSPAVGASPSRGRGRLFERPPPRSRYGPPSCVGISPRLGRTNGEFSRMQWEELLRVFTFFRAAQDRDGRAALVQEELADRVVEC